MQIAMADVDTSLENVQVLTDGFYSARAPEVSYDKKTLVFSAQKSADEVWQIWMLNLANKKQLRSPNVNTTAPIPSGFPMAVSRIASK